MPSHSFVQYAGDGTTGPFVIPFPFLDRSHVALSVDGVAAGFTFVSDVALVLDAPAPVGAVVEIRRATPIATRLVDFTDGAVLTEVDLDTALLQQLYLAQETFDVADTAIGLGPDGRYDAAHRRLVNVADPAADQDAATKGYVDSTTAASAAAAAASATSAATQAGAAASSASAAASAETDAQTAQAAAETAQAAAEAAAASLEGGPAPDGGAAGQVLKKASAADQDLEWGEGGPKANYSATDDPDADNDETEGYSIGSVWVNTATPKAFTCVDASEGAAVWSGGGGSVSIPIGAVLPWTASAIPTGWLECDGAAVSRTTYADLFAVVGETFGAGDGSTTFNLPDLRGEFVRGLDNGRGIDAARALGSAQGGQVGDHPHQSPIIMKDVDIWVDTAAATLWGLGDNVSTDPDRYHASTGGSGNADADYALTSDPYRAGVDESTYETRPRNIALKYIIKHADAHFTGQALTGLPDASTTEKGAVEIATQAEVDGGTETAKVVVPSTLNGLFGGVTLSRNASFAAGTVDFDTEWEDGLYGLVSGYSYSNGVFTLPGGLWLIIYGMVADRSTTSSVWLRMDSDNSRISPVARSNSAVTADFWISNSRILRIATSMNVNVYANRSPSNFAADGVRVAVSIAKIG